MYGCIGGHRMAYDNQRAQTHKHLLCTTMKAMNIDNHWSDYTHIQKNLMSTPISDGLVCVPMAYIYIRLHTIPYCLFSLGLTTRRDTDYPLRGRQPLRQDPWHCSEGLHPSDCPGPRPTDTTGSAVDRQRRSGMTPEFKAKWQV